MLKDDVKNNILMDMTSELTKEQLVILQNSITKMFYNVEMCIQNTQISVEILDNDILIARFIGYKRVEGLTERTIYQYARATKLFLDDINKHWKDISSDDISYYFAKILSKNTMNNTSLDNKRKYIKCFFNWLYENDYITKNPFIKIKAIKRIEKKKEILSDNEIEIIRDECNNNKKECALIDFLLATGVRVSECLSVNINDVNFNTGEVSIYSQKTKNYRTVFLDAKALKHLYDYLTCRNDNNNALFVTDNKNKNRLSKGSIEYLIHKIVKRTTIQKNVTVHMFRKTLVSKLYSNGMSINEIATIVGHKSTDTTNKYYLIIYKEQIKYNYTRCMN